MGLVKDRLEARLEDPIFKSLSCSYTNGTSNGSYEQVTLWTQGLPIQDDMVSRRIAERIAEQFQVLFTQCDFGKRDSACVRPCFLSSTDTENELAEMANRLHGAEKELLSRLNKLVEMVFSDQVQK